MERHAWHNLVFFKNLTNDARINKACLDCFDNGGYTLIQFLRAMSHSDDVDDVPPSAAVQPSDSDVCEVCLVEERDARHALILAATALLCVVCARVEEEAPGNSLSMKL